MRLIDKAKALCLNSRTLCLLIFSLALICTTIGSIGYAMSKQVSILDEDGEYTVNTLAQTTGDVLQKLNIALAEDDDINLPIDAKIKDGDVIKIARAKYVTLKNGDEIVTATTTKSTVEELLAELNIELNGAEMDVALDDEITNGMNFAIIRYKEEIITEDVKVPFETTKIATTALPEGEQKVKTEGKDGLNQKVYKVIKENGVEVSRELIAENVIEKPVKQVVEYGKTERVAYRGNTTSRSGSIRYSKVITVTATAYTASTCGKSPGSSGYGVTATGRKATYGMIAVDPRVIPLGSKVYIEGANGSWVYGEAVAADTGGAIKGNKIDLYMNTVSECLNFGRRQAKVYILE